MTELAEFEHLFRRHYARLCAALTHVFGPDRLDLVEDVVQDALLRAMRTWPFCGVPDDPAAWLQRVARNLALDALRHRKVAGAKAGELAAREELRAARLDEAPDADSVADDALRMIFTCCHPALPADARVALTLKTLCGFGVREIASALLAPEATVAQRLSRAKAKLQREAVRFEVPAPRELGARLDSVLEVLYLLFNEGYRAHRGADLVRQDLVADAVRLVRLLTSMRETDRPKVHALLALMLFLGSRLGARLGAGGELLALAEQDRSLWDRRWTDGGFAHLRLAARGDELTPFHVEAAIASLHAAAPDYASTDWPRILARYDELVALTGSPVVRLNRVVAVAKVHGPDRALRELDALDAAPELRAYALLHATRAHLAWHAGARDDAVAAYRAALLLPSTEPERALLERRLARCAADEPPPAF